MKPFDTTGALQWFYLMRQGSAILTGILLAQLGLPADQIGVYEILQYIGLLVSAFWVTGLSQALLSYFPTLPEPEQRRLTGSAFLLFTGLSALLLAALWFGQNLAIPALASRPALPYYELFLLWQFFNLPAFLIENLYLLHKKAKAIFWFGILGFGLQMVAVLAPVALGADFIWSFYGLIALGVLKFTWISVLILQTGQLSWDAALLRKWIRLAWPLALYALLGGLIYSFSFWLVGHLYRDDEATFAVFRYGAREFPLVIALTGALSAAIIPALATNLQDGLSQLKTRSLRLFHLLFPLSILLMLTSKYFFPIVFTDAFSESAIVFNAFLLITVSRVLFPRSVLMALRSNQIALLSSVIELIFIVTLSLVLAPYFGLMGIAMGTTLGASLEKIILCIYLDRRFGIGVSQYTDMKWWVGYSVLLVAAFGWSVCNI
ncbi:MAG: polysaccharide biosynthesis C-terminal domain-containing protein [Saprospiraceae bacterium]|nr:polysaccharide biosynthesis C-terminal domain-containing protein [Saprospiraceae bacterium]